MDKLFIDTNILIYANDDDSPYHNHSFVTLIELSKFNEFIVSTQTIREYLKVMSVSSSFKKALTDINILRRQFEILHENEESFNIWLELIEKYNVIGKVIFDCNIVATMLANNVKKILTNNPKDFLKFENEIEIIPLVK